MSSSDEKMIKDVTKAVEENGLASTADVARKIGTSRPTASKYLKKAEEKGLVAEVYTRKETKIYSSKSMEIKKRIKTPLEINKETEEAFKKYEVID